MTHAPIPFERWQELLQDHVSARCTLMQRVIAIRETTSTQDAARQRSCVPGDVVVSWRQTSGRGRLGRVWADTADHGVAVTLVVTRDQPERLAIASAIGVALAAEGALKSRVGIKWPNDIIVNGRKLAGILVEQFDDLALIGVGMNVHQATWPEDLAQRAISLRQLGVEIDRLTVLQAIIEGLDTALRFNGSALTREFALRDVLSGTTVSFRVGQTSTTGAVLRIDPMRGLAVQVNGGEIWLQAAVTSLREP